MKHKVVRRSDGRWVQADGRPLRACRTADGHAKYPFKTQEAARAEADRINARRSKFQIATCAPLCEAYACDEHGWHVGRRFNQVRYPWSRDYGHTADLELGDRVSNNLKDENTRSELARLGKIVARARTRTRSGRQGTTTLADP